LQKVPQSDEKSEKKYLSHLERERFAVLRRFDNVKDAAAELGVASQTLYNWLWMLRKKYKRQHGWCNAILSQRSNDLLRSVLSEKKPLPPVKDGTEFTEDQTEEKWQSA
jgi:transposase-like protein